MISDSSFIDKTDYIFSLVHNHKRIVSLESKIDNSYLLTNIQKYYQGDKQYFTNTKIIELENIDAKQNKRTKWQSFPVFTFDFSKFNYSSFSDFQDSFDKYLFFYESMFEGSLSINIPNRLFEILKCAYLQLNQKSVILINQYDIIFSETISRKNEYIQLLNSFFDVLQKADEYIECIFITGKTIHSEINYFSNTSVLYKIDLKN